MKPLPKAVGAVFAVAAVIATIDPSILAPLTPYVGEAAIKAVVAVAVLIVGLSHSLTGTGGK